MLFTVCHVGEAPVALLAPLAVAPKDQRRGIGTALVRTGLAWLSEQAIARVFVLGDPDYYGRFGFAREDHAIPPYPIPEAWAPAWQSLSLGNEPLRTAGPLLVPPPWQDPLLWQA